MSPRIVPDRALAAVSTVHWRSLGPVGADWSPARAWLRQPTCPDSVSYLQASTGSARVTALAVMRITDGPGAPWTRVLTATDEPYDTVYRWSFPQPPAAVA